jgi:hypothetical protein
MERDEGSEREIGGRETEKDRQRLNGKLTSINPNLLRLVIWFKMSVNTKEGKRGS